MSKIDGTAERVASMLWQKKCGLPPDICAFGDFLRIVFASYAKATTRQGRSRSHQRLCPTALTPDRINNPGYN
jgi:hypothetical protein